MTITWETDNECWFWIRSKTHGLHKVLISREDAPRISRYRWSVTKSNTRRDDATFVVQRRVREGRGGYTIYLHRFIIGPPTDPAKAYADHVDTNPLNNTRQNLRYVSNRENCQNRINVKGYSFNKRIGKYQAYIGVDWQLKHLGFYTDECDAKAARLAAERLYFPTKPIRD